MSGYTFISYSRTDIAYVDNLASFLQSHGVAVWYDRASAPGAAISSEIASVIDGCVAFMLVMTPESNASDWVRREVWRALDKGKEIVPLLLRGSEPAFLVQERNWIDVRGDRMPPQEVVDLLLFVQSDRSPDRMERYAARVLARDDGPVARYQSALDVIRAQPDAISGAAPTMPPSPTAGTSVDRVAMLTRYMVSAVGTLEDLAERSRETAHLIERGANQAIGAAPAPPYLPDRDGVLRRVGTEANAATAQARPRRFVPNLLWAVIVAYIAGVVWAEVNSGRLFRSGGAFDGDIVLEVDGIDLILVQIVRWGQCPLLLILIAAIVVERRYRWRKWIFGEYATYDKAARAYAAAQEQYTKQQRELVEELRRYAGRCEGTARQLRDATDKIQVVAGRQFM